MDEEREKNRNKKNRHVRGRKYCFWTYLSQTNEKTVSHLCGAQVTCCLRLTQHLGERERERESRIHTEKSAKGLRRVAV